MRKIAVADVGGTHARFAIAEIDDGKVASLGEPITLHTSDFSSFQTAWQEFGRRLGHDLPDELGISFAGIWTVAADAGIPLGEQWVRNPQTREYEKLPAQEKSRGASASQWQAEKILDAGYGLAVFYYGDVEPDFTGGL